MLPESIATDASIPLAGLGSEPPSFDVHPLKTRQKVVETYKIGVRKAFITVPLKISVIGTEGNTIPPCTVVDALTCRATLIVQDKTVVVLTNRAKF